jgi:hypothetical protein
MSLHITNSVISGNTITAAGSIGIYTATGSSNNQIIGNVVYESTSDGMQLNGDNTTVIGNSSMNAGNGGGTHYGVYIVAGSNCSILNNRIGDDQGSPTQTYGVRAPSGATVRGNNLAGNATGPLFGAITSFNTGAFDTGLNMVASAATGTATQGTDKSTTVVITRASGEITMNNATLNAGTLVSFTLTNTRIALGDVLVLNHVTGGTPGAYLLNARCAAGSAVINVRNITAGNLAEAIVIAFNVVKPFTA